MPKSKLEILRERAAELRTQIDANRDRGTEILLVKDPSTEQLAELQALTERGAADRRLVDQVDAQIREEEAAEARSAQTRAAQAAAGTTPTGSGRPAGGATVTSEPMVYGRGSRSSYFLDLARSDLNRGDGDGGVQAARDRLRRHAQELEVELPAREARREARAREQVMQIDGVRAEHRRSVFERGDVEQRVNPNRTDGQGGYFVPPLWLVDQYIALARFGRQTANLCLGMDLPSGTDSINIPKVNTGTTTAAQTADNAAVSSTDLTDTFVNAPVRTIAGQQDLALQLLDQSPISFDQIVFTDLISDYNMRLDIQVINGSGTSGQHLGILNVSGVNSVTYTDASVTLPEMYPAFAQGASQVYKNRKLPATAAVIYPSTWYWATAQLDTTNRPLIVPPQVGWNPAGTQMDLATGDGPAGMLSMGLPGYLDGNLPTNLGGGSNETRVIVARFPDLYLWEGSLRSRTLTEVLSGTLQVRFQVYAYSAFMAGRRPESISVLSGTGFIPQSGY
jgi:HK97 family phage major capsid protein